MEQRTRFIFVLAAIVCSNFLLAHAAPVRRDTGANSGASTQVPQFLVNVYECWSNGRRDCLPEADPEVNVVRSLIGQFEENPTKAVESSTNKELTQTVSVEFAHKTSFSFASHETLYTSQLRIYKTALSQEKIQSLETNCNLSSLQLQLYSMQESTDVAMLEKTLPISLSSLSEDMWLNITNVTDLYQIKMSASSFKIRLGMGGDGGCSAMTPSEFGITVVEPGKQPEFIGYAKGSVEDKLFASVQRRRKRQQEVESREGSGDVPDYIKHKLGVCQIYNLTVSFTEIGWDRHIIRPVSYNANFCAGRCDWPLDTAHTKHSYIQSVANIHNRDLVPPPCCAPSVSDLSALPVVVREAGNTYSTRLWTEMIATSCSCL